MKKLFFTISIISLLFSAVQAQQSGKKTDETEKGVFLKLQENARPDVYVDGVKYPKDIIDIIDQNKIGSIQVLKTEADKKEYDAPNGVILITTKQYPKTMFESSTVVIKDYGKKDSTYIKIRAVEGIDPVKPVILIDGVQVDEKTLKKMSPDIIKEMRVEKNEKVKKKYNTESGVIFITTKTGDFRKNKK